MANSTQSQLKVKLASKFGNTGTRFYSDEDRTNALNWARDMLGQMDFPELWVSTTLTFAPYTLFNQSVAKASEPLDMRRIIKIWDTVSTGGGSELLYATPDQFDRASGKVFTREIVSGTRYIFVKPSSTTTMSMRYIKKVPWWTITDGALQNEWDERYDDAIVDGAIGWLNLKGKNYNEVTAYTNQYKNEMSRMFNDLINQGGWTDNPKLTSYYEKASILTR